MRFKSEFLASMVANPPMTLESKVVTKIEIMANLLLDFFISTLVPGLQSQRPEPS